MLLVLVPGDGTRALVAGDRISFGPARAKVAYDALAWSDERVLGVSS